MRLPAPKACHVPRGEPIEFELTFDPADVGSPSPTLTFTLSARRNTTTKLHTMNVEALPEDPLTYRILLDPTLTDREPGIYWWDVWRLDIPQLVAIGSLEVQGVVRLP